MTMAKVDMVTICTNSMREILHQIAMAIIVIGGVALFFLALWWFSKGNIPMGSGMLIMALIAGSNYYLHRRMMKK